MGRLAAAGIRLPSLGLGTAALGGLHGPVTKSDAAAALETAWEAGIRFYDTAPLYGRGLGELRTGTALRERARDSVVLSTKVGWRMHPLHRQDGAPAGALPFGLACDYSRDGTLRSVEDSLTRLGLARIDIALVHDVDPYNHGDAYPQRRREVLDGALPALRQLQAEGVVGAVGIGVNDPAVCLDILRLAELDCILLAGRYTLLDGSAAETLLPECLRCGIDIIVGAPFNTGILARGSVHGARYHHRAADPDIVARVVAIEAICERHGVALPAAALRFPLRHPAVVSVLPGPRSAAQVREIAVHAAAVIPDAFWHDLGVAGLLPTAKEPA